MPKLKAEVEQLKNKLTISQNQLNKELDLSKQFKAQTERDLTASKDQLTSTQKELSEVATKNQRLEIEAKQLTNKSNDLNSKLHLKDQDIAKLKAEVLRGSELESKLHEKGISNSFSFVPTILTSGCAYLTFFLV